MASIRGGQFHFPQTRTNYTALLDATQQHLGFDPSILINVSLILAAVSTGLVYGASSFYRWASKSILSSANISEEDTLYTYVMDYMGDHYISTKRFRSVKARTSRSSSLEEEEKVSKELDQEHDIRRLISYRAAISRAPISLTPYQATHFFRHRGSWLFFKHSLIKHQVNLGGRSDRGHISIQCFGRSVAPIKAFLEDTQVHALQKNMSKTIIYRALSSTRDHLKWHQVLSRPSRDIRTVILDRSKKRDLLVDINEYLHPRTRKFYANHGIPYRRGYLFSGPPGTGKTSLTAALAGVFGLNIYVLSLLDPMLSEGHLNKLMSEIPSRSILLIEDVDAAGLKRKDDITKDEKHRREQGAKNALKDEVSAVKEAVGGEVSSKAATEISLSGLLNAIDGVSSHEGRILVMTTNSPDSLDKALTRPGRVDMHVAFNLPARAEIEELFVSMYHEEAGSLASLDQSASKSIAKENGTIGEKMSLLSPKTKSLQDKKPNRDAKNGLTDLDDLEIHASKELQEMATKFAEALPEGKLSLATIQGFLLRWKREPHAACEYAAAWAEEAIADQI